MQACMHDRLEPCYEDCPDCERGIYCKECDHCGYSGNFNGNVKFYAKDGFTLCEDCLVEAMSKSGSNLYDEFIRESQDEYREFVLDYFEEDKINE